MRISLSESEQKLVQAALDFANLRKIESARQVENLFIRALHPDFGAGYFKVLKSNEGSVFLGDQKKLREWLDSIAIGKTWDTVTRTVEGILSRTIEGKASARFHTGRIVYDFHPKLTGVEACYSYGVALMLDRTRGLTARVSKCEWKPCGRYFVTWEGKPKAYCRPSHREKNEVLLNRRRVSRWWKRQGREVRRG